MPSPGIGARDQGPVGQAHLAGGDEFGEHHLHRCDVRRQAPQPPVVLRLIRQIGKESRQQPTDRPQKPRSETIPVIACATAKATISSSVTFPTGPGRGSRNVVANT
jgi:hypothetical protein